MMMTPATPEFKKPKPVDMQQGEGVDSGTSDDNYSFPLSTATPCNSPAPLNQKSMSMTPASSMNSANSIISIKVIKSEIDSLKKTMAHRHDTMTLDFKTFRSNYDYQLRTIRSDLTEIPKLQDAMKEMENELYHLTQVNIDEVQYLKDVVEDVKRESHSNVASYNDKVIAMMEAVEKCQEKYRHEINTLKKQNHGLMVISVGLSILFGASLVFNWRRNRN